MYGLLIESLSDYLRVNYGDDAWEQIRKAADLDATAFSVQQVYPEQMLPRIVSSASRIVNISEVTLMENVGVHFVKFVSQYGYDRMLSVLGRHMRDFLSGLDNLHEYMRFSYPRMRPPSFFCENENKDGLTLHYRTRRRGYLHYVVGQIKEVGELFYHTPIKVEILEEEMQGNCLHVVMQLQFDNSGFDDETVVILHEEAFLPIRAHVFFELFPFSVVFDQTMTINVLGSSLHTVMVDALGNLVTQIFSLTRPVIEFTWESILGRTNNIFELMTIEPMTVTHIPTQEAEQIRERCLQLKGQMLYMDDWKSVIFLGTPVMPDLETMIQTGLYINDLSMHDFSRDLMLAGTQQSVELKLALDQEQKKTKRLEDSMRKLDEEMRRTDELLYQMIPKTVADRLRKGECSVATCEVFDSVTILFSDVVTFTEMCSRITPMDVVTLLNCMYSLFDHLTEKHNVYKVETIGDAYMVVAGAPEAQLNHANKIADMALDMLHVIKGLKDPSTNKNIRIRVGIHSGNVVAGVVGVKMPRYCLFGDAVNTTSRMESSSEAMKIQVSADTRQLLPSNYKFEARGSVTLKGKGRMQTFWLVGRDGYTPPVVGQDGFNIVASTHYSPVMMSDSILERDSLAYSALSMYSTPSRPTTALDNIGDGPTIAVTSETPIQLEEVASNWWASPIKTEAPPPPPPPAAAAAAAPPPTAEPPVVALAAPAVSVPLPTAVPPAAPRIVLPEAQPLPKTEELPLREQQLQSALSPQLPRPPVPVSQVASVPRQAKSLVDVVEARTGLMAEKPVVNNNPVPVVACNFQCQSATCTLQ